MGAFPPDRNCALTMLHSTSNGFSNLTDEAIDVSLMAKEDCYHLFF